ncbi:membrane protein MLC1-like, partial [Pyxicephalus adspersus]|uniref:membrane protein MLC1-like n=1 Tax=Pyxicephalus adspersus TaxID=30357 RepID=UPI003B5C4468
MTREDGYNEEYSYDRMASLELGMQESRMYHTDLKLHPCVKYKTWMFSLLIGSGLIATSGFSLYLGNVFPSEMDYLRCAAGSVSIPSFGIFCSFVSSSTKTNIVIRNMGSTCGSSNNLKHVQFPAKTMKFFSIIEVVVGMSAVFGGVIGLHMEALLDSPFLYVSIFWVLAA